MSTKYYLTREIERARAKHQPIEIVLPAIEAVEGSQQSYPERTVTVPPAQLWTDEQTIASATDPVRAARMLLGPEHYEHWIAGGGTAGIFFDIIRLHAGATGLGESSKS